MILKNLFYSFIVFIFLLPLTVKSQIKYTDHELGASLSRLTILGDQGIDYIELFYRYSNISLNGYRASLRILSPEEKDVDKYFRIQIGKDWLIYRIDDFVFYYGMDVIYGRYRIRNRPLEINVAEVGIKGVFGVKLYLWQHISISTEPSLEFLVAKEKSEQKGIAGFERRSFQPDVYNLGQIRLSIQF